MPEPEKRQPIVDRELNITLHKACELLDVTPQTHWIRAVAELTRDAKPYSIITLQAIKR